MEFDTIPISELIQHHAHNEAAYLQNGRVLVTPVDKMELFSQPVRLNAITVLICLQGQIRCSINLQNILYEKTTSCYVFQAT